MLYINEISSFFIHFSLLRTNHMIKFAQLYFSAVKDYKKSTADNFAQNIPLLLMHKICIYPTMIKKIAASIATILITFQIGFSQSAPFSYSNPENYVLSGITVSGIRFVDPSVIINLSGLFVGDTISIPSEIGRASCRERV